MSDSPSSDISRQTIQTLASLARLDLTPDEEVSYQKDLAAIVGFVNQLNQADVSGCQPLHQVTGLTNRWRQDQAPPPPDRQQPGSEALLPFFADRLVDGQFKSPRPLTDQPASAENQ